MITPPRRDELRLTSEGELSLRHIIYLEELADTVNALDGTVEVTEGGNSILNLQVGRITNLSQNVENLTMLQSTLLTSIRTLRAEVEDLKKQINDLRCVSASSRYNQYGS
jgi:hypothetical protein